MTDEQIKELIEKHCNQLAEHFDAVQILVSGVNEHGNTYLHTWGIGNYFARAGMCHDFVGKEAAIQIANELNE